jgi:hypothetical protein
MNTSKNNTVRVKTLISSVMVAICIGQIECAHSLTKTTSAKTKSIVQSKKPSVKTKSMVQSKKPSVKTKRTAQSKKPSVKTKRIVQSKTHRQTLSDAAANMFQGAEYEQDNLVQWQKKAIEEWMERFIQDDCWSEAKNTFDNNVTNRIDEALEDDNESLSNLWQLALERHSFLSDKDVTILSEATQQLNELINIIAFLNIQNSRRCEKEIIGYDMLEPFVENIRVTVKNIGKAVGKRYFKQIENNINNNGRIGYGMPRILHSEIDQIIDVIEETIELLNQEDSQVIAEFNERFENLIIGRID